MREIPEKVSEIINKHRSLLRERFSRILKGYYVFGSVALGSFNYGYSDIDFLVVVSRELGESDIILLKQIHSEISNQFPKTDLMGLYVMESDLKGSNDNKVSCPCFIDGKYKGLVKFDKNSIDAFQLKKYGITVEGPSTEEFDYIVNWDILINSMRDNINSYWFNWLNGCKKFLTAKYIGMYFSLKSIEWGVLGVSRLFYSFKERDITSKVGAGDYALKYVPSKWHKIIKEAMRLRIGNKKSYYSSIFTRRNDAVQYMDFIIRECNRLFS